VDFIICRETSVENLASFSFRTSSDAILASVHRGAIIGLEVMDC